MDVCKSVYIYTYVQEYVLKPSPHTNKTGIASFIIKLLRFFLNWTWTVNDKKPQQQQQTGND